MILSEVLNNIYDYGLENLYIPALTEYKEDTVCAVGYDLKDANLTRYINLAVVSDVCDEVPDGDIKGLIEAFNKEMQEGGWLFEFLHERAE